MKKIYRQINLFLIPYFLISCSRLTEPQKEKDLDKVEQKIILCTLATFELFKDRDTRSLGNLYCGINGAKEVTEIENRRVF